MKLNVLAIKHIMLDKGMSKKKLAEESGITYQRICSYLTGYCKPNLNTLEKIINALGVNPVDIIEMED